MQSVGQGVMVAMGSNDFSRYHTRNTRRASRKWAALDLPLAAPSTAFCSAALALCELMAAGGDTEAGRVTGTRTARQDLTPLCLEVTSVSRS